MSENPVVRITSQAMGDGTASVAWSYADPGGSAQSAFRVRFLDVQTMVFSVTGSLGGEIDGTYKFSRITRFTMEVYFTGDYVQGFIVPEFSNGSGLANFDGTTWKIGNYSGVGATPAEVTSWKRYGHPSSLSVTNINASEVDTGWVSSAATTYSTASLPKGICAVTVTCKNSLAIPLESVHSGCVNIARDPVPWTKKALSVYDFVPSMAGDTHSSSDEWLTVYPLLLKDYEDFPIDSWERTVVGGGFLEKIDGEWVISPHAGYGVFANLYTDESVWSSFKVTDSSSTTDILNQLNMADQFTYRIDAPPSVPVAMMKMRGDNPYFEIPGRVWTYFDTPSLTNSDVTGCGGSDGGYSEYGNIYKFVGFSWNVWSIPKPANLSPLPKRNPSISSGVSLRVDVMNQIFLSPDEITAARANGYSDAYTVIPGKLWARISFSSDGRGGSLVQYPMEAELQNQGGNWTTLTFHVPPEVIGSNEFVEEVALYWRKPYAYFRKVPFPTSISDLSVGAYHVIPIGLTLTGRIDIGHES